MTYKRICTVVLLCFMSFQLYAQVTLPVARNIQATFDKNTRTASGKPGDNYWQNSAVYNLQLNFNPSTRLISGKADIDYTNHSPDTLNEIVFKLFKMTKWLVVDSIKKEISIDL